VGRGRDFRGGGKGRRPYQEDTVAPDLPSARDQSRPPSLPVCSAPSGIQPIPVEKAPDVSSAIDMLGTVKWFNLEKGMGFVEVDCGGKDVFLHASVAKRARLTNLVEGQRVAMRVVEAPKGRQAVSIAAAA
jgi:cold shock CspA family protein